MLLNKPLCPKQSIRLTKILDLVCPSKLKLSALCPRLYHSREDMQKCQPRRTDRRVDSTSGSQLVQLLTNQYGSETGESRLSQVSLDSVRPVELMDYQVRI